MAPFAPGRFSTTAGWPSCSCSLEAIARPTMSDEPPATNGMITRIGFDGNDWASAPLAARARATAIRRFIGAPVEAAQFTAKVRARTVPQEENPHARPVADRRFAFQRRRCGPALPRQADSHHRSEE